MVSTISMPETVAAASLPASRICTRVTFTRFAEIKRAMPRFITTDAMPMAANSGL